MELQNALWIVLCAVLLAAVLFMISGPLHDRYNHVAFHKHLEIEGLVWIDREGRANGGDVLSLQRNRPYVFMQECPSSDRPLRLAFQPGQVAAMEDARLQRAWVPHYRGRADLSQLLPHRSLPTHFYLETGLGERPRVDVYLTY